MFALLEHTTPDGHAHWDFLIEIAGQERLATWRLSQNPLETPGEITAERLPDHRRVYLEYEGPLTKNRGSVRRLDRGNARVLQNADALVVVDLSGAQLRGRAELRVTAAGAWILAVERKTPGEGAD